LFQTEIKYYFLQATVLKNIMQFLSFLNYHVSVLKIFSLAKHSSLFNSNVIEE
jgi:hypothetical protein